MSRQPVRGSVSSRHVLPRRRQDGGKMPPLDIAPRAPHVLSAMPEPKNSRAQAAAESDQFGNDASNPPEDLARLVEELHAAERLFPQRIEGARPVVLWLPDTRDPAYRTRLADQCRRLARLTSDEEAMAAGFEQEAAQIPGWR